MSNLAERLRQLRVQHDLNQSQLARLAGMKPQIVQLIEAGKVLQSKHLFALAHVLQTSAEWLLTGSHSGAAFTNAVQVSKNNIKLAHLGEKPNASKISSHVNRSPAADEIPIYSAINDHNGVTFSFDMQQIIGYAPAHPRQQRMHGAFAFYCVGDNMSPRYENGELIYCLQHQPLKPGQDILVTLLNDQQAILGRLIKYDRAGQKMSCEQLNPAAKHHFNLKEVIEIYTIVGRG